nr:nAChR subunit [Hymenolepis microstoma]
MQTEEEVILTSGKATMRTMWITKFFILSVIIYISNCLEEFKFHSIEKMLIKKLLEKYEKVGKIGRPVRNTSGTVNVEFGLSLFQLTDLDEAEQLFTVNVWNKYAWYDEVLTWDPKEYNDIKHVRIPTKHVWTPDIVLLNYADKRLQELREVLLTVDYTGRIIWSPPAIYKSVCTIQMEHFPFDHQICYLRFASWTLHGKKLNLTFLDGIESAMLDVYQPSNEWHIVIHPAVRRFFKQSCCEEPLRRNAEYYAYLLVLPCILLAVLNLVVFWLPPQNPARMMLGMNIFSGFCIQLKFLTQSTPSASNTIPYLGYYYCLNMVLIAIFTFFSVIAVQIHFRKDKTKPLPPWLSRFVKTSSKWLRLKPGPLCFTKPPQAEANISKIEMHLNQERKLRRRDSFESHPGQTPRHCYCQQQQTQQQTNQESQHEMLALTQRDPFSNLTSTTAGKQLEASVKEIKRTLRNLMHKFNTKDKNSRQASEWDVVGMVIDRYCFWAYLVLIVVTGMITLIPPMPYEIDENTPGEVLISRFKELAKHVDPID